MKKIFKYFSLLLVFALVVTGCGKDKKEETKNVDGNNGANVSLEDAIKNSKDVKNAKFNGSITFGLIANDKAMLKYDVSLDGKIDSKQNMYFKGQAAATEEDDVDVEYGEAYLDFENKKLYTLSYTNETKDEEEWQKETIDEDNVKKFNNFDFSKLLSYIKESKKVDSDRAGEDKYEVKVDVIKAIKEFAISEGEDLEEIEALEKQIALPDLTFNVYVKGNYVSGFEADLGEVLTTSVGPLLQQLASTQSGASNMSGFKLDFKLSLHLSDFGTVEDINIPEEIVKNANESVTYIEKKENE